jgi:hypothetical protein
MDARYRCGYVGTLFARQGVMRIFGRCDTPKYLKAFRTRVIVDRPCPIQITSIESVENNRFNMNRAALLV